MFAHATTLVLATAFALAAPSSDDEGLPRAVISRVVHSREGAMRECYVAGLKRNRDLQGTLTTRFVIARDGHVSWAGEAPSSKFPDAKVADCVVAEFAALVFPPPDAWPVPVVYPITFSPD